MDRRVATSLQAPSTAPEEEAMEVQLLVVYPTPKDAKEFERRYREEHLPYAGPRLMAAGATKVVTRRVHGSPAGAPVVHAISEVTFPSLAAAQACAASSGGKEALAHAASISSGGAPQFLVVGEV
jgi:uncharacterized protein (TIGR02118 family)